MTKKSLIEKWKEEGLDTQMRKDMDWSDKIRQDLTELFDKLEKDWKKRKLPFKPMVNTDWLKKEILGDNHD